MPQDVTVFHDDFIGANWSETADAAIWNETLVAQAATGLTILDGTDDAEDEAGGVLKITTEATVNDGENLQVNGESFHLDGSYPLYFETRINVADVSNLEYFIGIAQTDAEIISGGIQNRVGFEMLAGVLSFVSEETSAKGIFTGTSHRIWTVGSSESMSGVFRFEERARRIAVLTARSISSFSSLAVDTNPIPPLASARIPIPTVSVVPAERISPFRVE